MGEDPPWPLDFTSRGALLRGCIACTRGSLKRTTSQHIRRATPGAVERKLGSTDVDGKWQLDSPTAANDEKTQTVTGYKRRAPMAAADAPNNASNLPAAVQHNADKEKEKPVEAAWGPG